MSHAETAIETSKHTGVEVALEWHAGAHFVLDRRCGVMSVEHSRYRFIGADTDGGRRRPWVVTMRKPFAWRGAGILDTEALELWDLAQALESCDDGSDEARACAAKIVAFVRDFKLEGFRKRPRVITPDPDKADL
jgi:hypothetical protein